MAVSPRPWPTVDKALGHQSAESLSSLTIALTAQHHLPPGIRRLVLTGYSESQEAQRSAVSQRHAQLCRGTGELSLVLPLLGQSGELPQPGHVACSRLCTKTLRSCEGDPKPSRENGNLELNADGDQAETNPSARTRRRGW